MMKGEWLMPLPVFVVSKRYLWYYRHSGKEEKGEWKS